MNIKAELELTTAAGGMIGDANRAQWSELLERQGGGLVRMSIGKLKQKTMKRQVSVEAVAKDLGHKLGVAAEISTPAPTPSVAPIRIAKPPPAVVVDDQVDDQVEHAPTPAAPPQPATEKKRRAPIDWLALLKDHPGTTAAELASVVERPRAVAFNWLSNHPNLVVSHGEKPRRYWLKGSDGAPTAESAPVAAVSTTGGAAQPQVTPERAVKTPRSASARDPRPSRPSAPPAAPDPAGCRCNSCGQAPDGGPCGWCWSKRCTRLEAELAKALVESDELGAEIKRLQARPAMDEFHHELAAALTAITEALVDLDAISKA